MNVLLIGSGGREHALAWKLAQSPRLAQLFVAPGNAGTLRMSGHPSTERLIRNLEISADEIEALCTFANNAHIDLAIIGPEAPLAAGLADALYDVGMKVFGPTQSAAQIEVSKAFAKDFMARNDIPTARYAIFDEHQDALAHLRQVDYPIVIKASGLAAGKGVILPQSTQEAEAALDLIMLQGKFGAAGDLVVIEERLSGKEVSLLAFTDGKTVRAMPPVQDHKRLLDGDRGPNTGGMGTCTPPPYCSPSLIEECTRIILQPTVDGLRKEGTPFIGVLYAGLILTSSGPAVLEFNCRFGDPETQVILPLLESDLLELTDACASGSLADMGLCWKPGAAACIVLASGGYPEQYKTGVEVRGLDSKELPSNVMVFHAGTVSETDTGQVFTAGGRVLGVTGWADTLDAALDTAYIACQQIHFDGMHFRRDIGGATKTVQEQ